ncbi:type IV toxin-antitoxin system AbiEi family antitoxin domain-containing protein [Rhizobium leguminosarum]|uniref:type IV toxin-antitoxin system AbiEi family antitoxin domain-containing protein n=1 Tax=Rhizobium leguminosarum TaxID=384 RepID=UPI003F9712DA
MWFAIGRKDWAPISYGTPIRIVRFTESLLHDDVDTHVIEGVPVKVFGIAKTTVDSFRYRSKLGPFVAIEGFRKRCGSASPRPVKLPTRLNVAVATLRSALVSAH